MSETAYEHLDGEPHFTVTADERWSITMLNKLKAKYPNEVQIIYQNKDGSMIAHLPKEWMRIAPKRKVNLSEERRAELRERFAKMRESSQASQ